MPWGWAGAGGGGLRPLEAWYEHITGKEKVNGMLGCLEPGEPSSEVAEVTCPASGGLVPALGERKRVGEDHIIMEGRRQDCELWLLQSTHRLRASNVRKQSEGSR